MGITEIKLIVMALMFLGAAAFGAAGMHKIDSAELNAFKADVAEKAAAALEAQQVHQKEIDDATAAANAAAIAQRDKALADTQARLAQVQRHIPAGKNNCITWGLLRFSIAPILKRDVDTMELPPGATDATCASVPGSDFGANIVTNYGIAARNHDKVLGWQGWAGKIAEEKK